MPRRYNLDPHNQLSLFDDLDTFPDIEQAANLIAHQRRASVLGNDGNTILFMSMGSGSSGNCSYIGDAGGGFLIDAGVDADTVLDTLSGNAIDPSAIHGILLTHDHHDHVRAVYSIVRRHRHIGIYCTPRTLSGLLRRHNISRRINDYHHPIYKEFEFRLGNFRITPFDVSHDGTDNCGFFITDTSGKHSFAVATDLGCITPRVEFYMSQANHIVIESNYDATMLRQGHYPEYLKHRIAADNGHLDNAVTAEFIKRIYTPALRHVFLCHLSHDNNTPDIAIATVKAALESVAGKGNVGDCSNSIATRDLPVQLMALPRYDPSPLMLLRRISNL